jgi:hypothetical protein
MIANSGHDERGKYTGGRAGDQTGSEFEVRPWYKRPWDCVCRAPQIPIGYEIAALARAAALNDRIGYDQGQRWSFLDALRRYNWEPGAIPVDCEADCSSGVITLIMAAGHRLGIDSLKTVNQVASYTGNMRAGLASRGFSILTDEKYLNSDRYLFAGDILLNEKHHTAINVDIGSAARAQETIERKPNPNPQWVGECTASLLNVRSGPGVTYSTIRDWPQLARGNWVDVCDSFPAADGSIWYYVRIYGRYYGYVHSGYIKRVT